MEMTYFFRVSKVTKIKVHFSLRRPTFLRRNQIQSQTAAHASEAQYLIQCTVSRRKSVHVSARPWPPDDLDMTHALNGLKVFKIKSTPGPHRRSPPATVQHPYLRWNETTRDSWCLRLIKKGSADVVRRRQSHVSSAMNQWVWPERAVTSQETQAETGHAFPAGRRAIK